MKMENKLLLALFGVVAIFVFLTSTTSTVFAGYTSADITGYDSVGNQYPGIYGDYYYNNQGNKLFLNGNEVHEYTVLEGNYQDGFEEESGYSTGSTFTPSDDYSGTWNSNGVPIAFFTVKAGQDVYLFEYDDTGSNTNHAFSIPDDHAISNVRLYTAVPIPGAAWLLGAGLFGLIGFRSRRKK